jgi:hypothetical protein
MPERQGFGRGAQILLASELPAPRHEDISEKVGRRPSYQALVDLPGAHGRGSGEQRADGERPRRPGMAWMIACHPPAHAAAAKAAPVSRQYGGRLIIGTSSHRRLRRKKSGVHLEITAAKRAGNRA